MTTPKILAFDTSAAHCAAALLVGDKVVQKRIEEMKKGQAERLMPLLEELLSDNSTAWTHLDAIAVGIGPGNFTGIRIGVSAARGLVLGLEKPAIGVSTLEAQVFGLERPVQACVPAPRDTAYLQDFTAEGPQEPAHLDMPANPLPLPSADRLVAAIAQIATQRLGQNNDRPVPLYIKAPDAAPSKTPAPTILP